MDAPITNPTPATAPTPDAPHRYAAWSVLVIVVIVLVGFAWWSSQSADNDTAQPIISDQPATNEQPMVTAETPTNDNAGGLEVIVGEVKTFAMTSFYELVDGQPKPQFSLKDITVKRGDTVRIVVTNTKGNHDINIDEFNVRAETPLNEEVAVEFVADKTGDFVYYCSKPGHRAAGHWGTLHVTE